MTYFTRLFPRVWHMSRVSRSRLVAILGFGLLAVAASCATGEDATPAAGSPNASETSSSVAKSGLEVPPTGGDQSRGGKVSPTLLHDVCEVMHQTVYPMWANTITGTALRLSEKTPERLEEMRASGLYTSGGVDAFLLPWQLEQPGVLLVENGDMLDYVSPEVLSTEVDDLLARLPSSDSALKGLLEEMSLGFEASAGDPKSPKMLEFWESPLLQQVSEENPNWRCAATLPNPHSATATIADYLRPGLKQPPELPEEANGPRP